MRPIKKALALLAILSSAALSSCTQADTVKNNIQKDADYFNVYRRMTFFNLRPNSWLYRAEGRFSVQTTYENNYQGQQELGLIFELSDDEYKMDYFSLGNNVTYIIEQIENTHTDPYYWEIVWYVPVPSVSAA